jgi:hypothetical protein
MKGTIVIGPLAALLVLGSLLLPSSVPGRSANERLEHGLQCRSSGRSSLATDQRAAYVAIFAAIDGKGMTRLTGSISMTSLLGV